MDQLVLNKKEVSKSLGISASTISRGVKAGTFPRPVRIGRRRIGWLRSEVQIFATSLHKVNSECLNYLAYAKTWRTK